MQNKQLIYDAVNFLQSLDDDKATFRNGVGFSKADSQVGHIAANLPLESWTNELAAEMAAVLVKYLDTQLIEYNYTIRGNSSLSDIIREIAKAAKGRDTIRATHAKLKAEEKIALDKIEIKDHVRRTVEKGIYLVPSRQMVRKALKNENAENPLLEDISDQFPDNPAISRFKTGDVGEKKGAASPDGLNFVFSFPYGGLIYTVNGADDWEYAKEKEKQEEKLERFKASRKITWERFDGREFRLCISWDWNDPEKYDILASVRKLPGRDYVPYTWGVPAKSWEEVLDFGLNWDFTCEGDRLRVSRLEETPFAHARASLKPTPHLRVVPEPTVEYVEPPLPLYPHQDEGIDYLRKNKKAFLTDEMGLGKTIQALMALPSATAALVVCPASLKGNWAREVKNWRPDLTPVILNGTGSFRWPCLGEIVIVNYELFPKVGEASYLTWEVNAIVDEAHYLKKGKSARTQKWRSIRRDIIEAGGSAWGMTGTPLVTTPYDLYGCLDSFGLLKQGYGSYNHFVSVWGGYKGRYGLEWSPNRINEKLAQEGLAKCSFGRKRIDVLPDLPSKRWTEIEVKLPKSCGKIDRESMDELEAWSKGGPTPIAGKLAEARRELAVAKGKKAIPFIDELIEGGGGPVVVFSAHVAPCKELGKYDRWECIVGDTPSEKRAEIVERFQMGELDGIAGTVGAMGVGLTLTKSCRMIFLDLPWSNSEIAQAEDRICRIGQKNACEYFLITSNSEVDQIIHKSITRKTKMTDNVDAVRSN